MNDSIFQPRFSISPDVEAYLADIERQSWLVDNMLLMPKHEAWISRDIRVQRAAGTTRIEGAGLGEDEVRNLQKTGAAGRHTEDEQANINALDAYEFIDFISDQPDIPIDELVIRQINRYFIWGTAETLTPGAYRKGENKVGSFTPPNQGDVPPLMRSFALWLQAEDEIHPVLKAAIAHVHLVAVHPFWDGNGRTARGLATLILQRSRFGFRKLLSLESLLSQNRDGYFSAIERTLGKSFDAAYDATRWLQFFVLALSSNANALTAWLSEWHRVMDELHKRGAAEGLLPRHIDGFMYAQLTRHITRSDYIAVTGVSPMTASRDLALLVDRGMLIAEGKTRSRVYYPSKSAPDSQGASPDEQLPLLET